MGNQRLTDDDRDDILQGRRDGLSYRVLAERFGCAKCTIERICHAAGVIGRTHSYDAGGEHQYRLDPYAKHGEYIRFLLQHEDEGVRCL